jgi:hypothetical protein
MACLGNSKELANTRKISNETVGCPVESQVRAQIPTTRALPGTATTQILQLSSKDDPTPGSTHKCRSLIS